VVSDPPALEFVNVTVRWRPGGSPVLAGVSLALPAGERAALVGLNGSGKTTLLLAAVGVLPFSGAIRVAGTPLTPRTAAQLRRSVGFLFNVPEDQLLFPDALEDTALALLQRGEGREAAMDRARAMLGALGVEEAVGKSVAELSHGQKQRVALAGALVARPSLLLLDEPSAGLDPPGKLELARRLASLDAAVLMATHDLEFAARVCRRFLLLDGGAVAYDGGDAGEPLRRWGVDSR